MLKDHVTELAERIGPRGSATPAELRGAEYIAGRFRDMGYETHIEKFRALKTYSWLHVFHYSLFIAAWALFFRAPLVAAALAVLGLAGYICETSSFELFSRLFPKAESRNVVANSHSKGQPSAKVVVTAHMDSSRSALFFSPKLAKSFTQTFILTLVGMGATLAGAVAFAAGFRSAWVWATIGVLNIQMLIALLMLVDREIRGRHTHGAVDNASGVAAMLGAAEELSKKPLENIELEFVGTGSEESGLFGMIHLLKSLRRGKYVYVINVDHVGIGNIVVISREGMLIRRDCDTEMLNLAYGFNLTSTGRAVGKHNFRTMLTDGYAALVRGYRAISIMAFRDDGTLPNWHWHTDRAAEISEENLQDAAALVVHLIKRVSGPGSRVSGKDK